MHTIRCIKDLPFVFIARPVDSCNGNTRVVMMEITEEQEHELDKNKSLSIDIDGLSFCIEPNMCYCYGKFDLSPNSEDLIKFDSYNWFSLLNIVHYVPTYYDYENHCSIAEGKGGGWYDTTNLKTYLPYLYACINKPERIVIFKEYTNPIYKQYHHNKREKATEKIAKSKSKKLNKLSKLVFRLK